MHAPALLRPLLARAEARTLVVLLLVVAGALWGFAALASEVVEGDTAAFDRAILLALRNPADLADPDRPPALETVMRDLTALGGVTVLALVTFGSPGPWRSAASPARRCSSLVAVGGGQVLSNLGKLAFNRARPDLVPHFTDVTSSSFPSGHSMMAAVTWLTLAVMLARAERSRAMRAYIVGLAVLVTRGGRGLARVSRRPLAVGRAGRVDGGGGLGAALRARRAAARPAGLDRAREAPTEP